MEGSDPTGSDSGNKAFWRTEKVGGECISEGIDRSAPGNGGKWACSSGGLYRSTAESGVFVDGTRKKPETNS